MSKSLSLCAAAIASLVAGMCIATSSNAQPTTSDAAYCRSLINAYAKGGNAKGGDPGARAEAARQEHRRAGAELTALR